MTDPHALPEILAALETGTRDIETYFLSIPAAEFFGGDMAHWGPAHHLSHLTLGHVRVGRAFGAPAALPAHPTGASRPFAAIREAYVTGLPKAPPEWLANNPLKPRLAEGATQPQVVADYTGAAERLRAAAAAWSEADADARVVPHPLLGALSAREMLFFFVLHDRHHLDGVRRRLGGER
jgi:hypothetical protein